MSTSAERQRRYRARQAAHKKGDHTLCTLGRTDCGDTVTGADDVTVSVTRPADTSLPAGLQTRGRRLWRDLTAAVTLGPVERVLLEEACRITDRLDRLDAILAGDPGEWMRFRTSDDGTEVTVTVDRALAEARAQAVALKQVVAEIRQSAGKAGEQPQPEVAGSDELAAARAARRAAAGL